MEIICLQETSFLVPAQSTQEKKDTFNLKALSVDTSLPLSVVTYLIRHAQYFALDQLESKTSILTYSQFLLPSNSPWVMA